MLDHESSNPYYRQIADYFAAQIRDEVLKPGRKLPSESELCSQFSVSRVTARKAIRELQQQRVVERLRMGYVVTSDSTQIIAFRQRYLAAIEEEYLNAKGKVEI